jgi:hypothetical protein
MEARSQLRHRPTLYPPILPDLGGIVKRKRLASVKKDGKSLRDKSPVEKNDFRKMELFALIFVFHMGS